MLVGFWKPRRTKGVGILFASKYTRIVTEHGALYDNRFVWIKMEGAEGGKIGFACLYAPNIPTKKRHMWHLMVENLPKDCDWIIGGNFNMTEHPEDKFHDCGRRTSGLEKSTRNELLSTLQVKYTFIYQGGPRFTWCNGQKWKARRLAKLDRFYLPASSKIEMKQTFYYIHGYLVESDHSPVQLEVAIGQGETWKSMYR